MIHSIIFATVHIFYGVGLVFAVIPFVVLSYLVRQIFRSKYCMVYRIAGLAFETLPIRRGFRTMKSDERVMVPMEYDFDEDYSPEQPWWYYSHLTETTLAALADQDAACLRCRCGGPVTAAKLSASGADDGPAYVYCEACYQNDLRAAHQQHIPIAEDTVSIAVYDIVWS